MTMGSRAVAWEATRRAERSVFVSMMPAEARDRRC